ncbi:MAG: dipeptidase PepE [Pseudomonadota bacterium]
MRLLLVANSGKPYLAHCKDQIFSFLKDSKKVGFVSAAPFLDPEEFFAKAKDALSGAPFEFVHLDLPRDPKKILAELDGVLVGGGNTYKLLKTLIEHDLIAPLRQRIKDGMPFGGWSAGANIAGPTILTTNDWNVVGLSKFEALNLVPFNINPHYLETDLTMAPHSETRDDRIAEYHKANRNAVFGIEESTMIRVEGKEFRVLGKGRVRVFRPGQSPVDFLTGQVIPPDLI